MSPSAASAPPGFAFGGLRRRRRPSLTPMIDVVFLLLVFFLLAARFSPDRVLPLGPGGGAEALEGPPRLVAVRPEGLALNGVALGPEALLAQLSWIAPNPEAAVVLRAEDGATVQDLAAALELLSGAGHRRLILVE